MKKLYSCFFVIINLFVALNCSAASPYVLEVIPANNSTNVDPGVTVRLQFSESLNPTTLNSQNIRIKRPDNTIVSASVNADLTNSAVTIATASALASNTVYTVEVTSGVKNTNGESAVPFTSKFTTGNVISGGVGFQFNKVKIDTKGISTTLEVGPDDHLYVGFADGQIKRYILDPNTGEPTKTEVVASLNKQIIGIAMDPDATASNVLIWVSYATCSGTDYFTGTISRVKVASVGSTAAAVETKYIIGLPHAENCSHQANGLAFDKNKILYQNVGGVATLGGTANWGVVESKLSAAIIYMDVKNPNFNNGVLPLNVKTVSPVNYNPDATNAPVKVYATGFRNALDMVFHTNGSLYTCTNQNSISSTTILTPSCNGAPAINASPDEMMYRVIKGNYYGHPNPSRGECVLNGGNPTSGTDPFEVTKYPVGVKPLPNFDPKHIWNIRAHGGNSANGMCEFKGPGVLNGRILVANFTGNRAIQAFRLDANGNMVGSQSLEDASGNRITFTGALDVCAHPKTNRIYVADFGRQSDWAGGSVYLLNPVGTSTNNPPVASFTASPQSGTAPLEVTFDASASSDPDNDAIYYSWSFGNGSTAIGKTVKTTYTTSGSFTAKLEVQDSKGAKSSTTRTITVGTTSTKKDALLITGSTTLPSGDLLFKNRLEALGYNVIVKTASASTTADATGKAVIFISASITSSSAGTKFKEVSQPVIIAESWLHSFMATGSSPNYSTGTSIQIVDGTHTLAAGLANGIQTIYGTNDRQYYAVPASTAKVVATVPGASSQASIFAYEAGVNLTDGTKAAGKRLGFFLSEFASSSPNNVKLIDAAIKWADPVSSGSNTPPVVSITSPTNNSSFTLGNKITIKANSSDSDGSVSKVEFYANNLKVGESITSPYQTDWTPQAAGSYTLTARSTDNNAATTVSSGVSITVNAQTVSANIALNKPVTVSSQPQPENPAAHLTDGSLTTRWAAEKYPQSATINLQGQFDINKFEIAPYLNRAYRYTISVSLDGTNYTTVVDRSNNTTGASVITDNVSNVKAQHVRVTVTGASGYTGAWVTLNEIMVYGQSSGSANTPPVVSITSPVNNSSFNLGNKITIKANSTDSDGSVSKVEFYANNLKVGESIASPYQTDWTPQAAGSYTLTARSTDNNVASTVSSGVSINVSSQTVSANIALTKPVTVSSQPQPENPAAHLTDGSLTTRWAADKFPQSATINLQGQFNINKFEIAPYLNRAYRYTIAVSLDGTNYTTVVDRSNNTTGASVITDNVSNVKAQYVRVTVTGASGYTGTWVTLNEIMVYGQASSSPRLSDPQEELSGMEVFVYPNPVLDELNVKILSVEDNSVVVSLITQSGIILRKSFESVDEGENVLLYYLNDIPNGTYILTIETGKEVYKKQILINK